ncbi:hypothetical protein [Clostridium sp. YIM B02569]|uniref:hypothetical protein n=1 Tax=Clostridium sp. YIM B02569 TaxID=2911967 RepID=UPI001EEA6532|nr:hypothetical protein [Clostridium sp. YIM B02569]
MNEWLVLKVDFDNLDGVITNRTYASEKKPKMCKKFIMLLEKDKLGIRGVAIGTIKNIELINPEKNNIKSIFGQPDLRWRYKYEFEEFYDITKSFSCIDEIIREGVTKKYTQTFSYYNDDIKPEFKNWIESNMKVSEFMKACLQNKEEEFLIKQRYIEKNPEYICSLKIGDKIYHKAFGNGIIKNIQEKEGEYGVVTNARIKVDFNIGTKILSAKESESLIFKI